MKIADLKPNSLHRCVRCRIHSDDICEAGSPADAARRANIRTDDRDTKWTINNARRLVFQKGYSLAGDCIKDLLKEQSLTPIQVRPWLSSLQLFRMNITERVFNTSI